MAESYLEDPEGVELETLCEFERILCFSTAMKLFSTASGEAEELLKLRSEFTLEDMPASITKFANFSHGIEIQISY